MTLNTVRRRSGEPTWTSRSVGSLLALPATAFAAEKYAGLSTPDSAWPRRVSDWSDLRRTVFQQPVFENDVADEGRSQQCGAGGHQGIHPGAMAADDVGHGSQANS